MTRQFKTNSSPGVALIASVAAAGGTAAMIYFFDSVSGNRRRTAVKNKLKRLARAFENEAIREIRDLENRAVGLFAYVKKHLEQNETTDEILEERIRASLRRLAPHLHRLKLKTRRGHVFLTGDVPKNRLAPLVRNVKNVPGVRSVISKLTGSERELSRGWALPHLKITPAERFVRIGFGSAAFLYSNRRKTKLRRLTRVSGAILVGMAVRDAVRAGIQTQGMTPSHGIQFHQSFTFQAPLERVYGFFSNFEEFPRFFPSLGTIQETDFGFRCDWIERDGNNLAWFGRMDRIFPDNFLSWTAEAAGGLVHTGSLFFESQRDGATRVHFRAALNSRLGKREKLPHRALRHLDGTLWNKDLKTLRLYLESEPAPKQQKSGETGFG